KTTTPTTTSGQADPGKAAVAALFQATSNRDTKALWNLLSKESQTRLGGYDAFKSQDASIMERALAPFASRPVTPFISQSISQQFATVAIRSGAKGPASPLRHEDGAWKIETPGPLVFRIISPQPGSTGTVDQIALEVDSKGVIDDALVWVDGKFVRPTLAPTQGRATVFANLTSSLASGVH